MVHNNVKDAVRKKVKKQHDMVDDIIAFETGELSQAGTKRLFQKLVNTGQVWSMQGTYGRMASRMLKEGFIKPPKKKTAKNTTDFYGNKIKF